MFTIFPILFVWAAERFVEGMGCTGRQILVSPTQTRTSDRGRSNPHWTRIWSRPCNFWPESFASAKVVVELCLFGKTMGNERHKWNIVDGPCMVRGSMGLVSRRLHPSSSHSCFGCETVQDPDWIGAGGTVEAVHHIHRALDFGCIGAWVGHG